MGNVIIKYFTLWSPSCTVCYSNLCVWTSNIINFLSTISSPPESSASGSSNVPRKPPRKKRHAPPPPGVAAFQTSSEGGAAEPLAVVTHSRHSSHSSGFDENLESPGNSSRESDKKETQDVRFICFIYLIIVN